jgi:multiple sugar transport system permease protein
VLQAPHGGRVRQVGVERPLTSTQSTSREPGGGLPGRAGGPAAPAGTRQSERRDAPRLRARLVPGRSTRLQLMLLAPAGLFLAVFCFYPLEELVRMSLSSVHSGELVFSSWQFVGLDNYRETLESADFTMAFVNTLVLMVVVVTITLVGGITSAVVLQRSTPGNQALQALIVFLWALPPLVTASVWKFLLSGDGLIATVLTKVGITSEPPTFLTEPSWALLTVAVAISWTGVAFASLVMRAGLLGVDRNQIEAAALDGANRRQVAIHVLLPALRPAIMVQALLAMIYAFRVFDYQFIMTSGGPGNSTTTLPYLAYKQSFGALNFGVGAATAVITVVMVVLFSLVYLWLIRAEESA